MADTGVLTTQEDEESGDYLSIQDAAAALGVKSSAIRRAIGEGSVTTQPHPWGVRVKRDDVAMLAQTIANQSYGYVPALPRTRVPRKPQPGFVTQGADTQLDQHVLAVGSEIGAVTLVQLHTALQTKYDAPFPGLVYSTRRLVSNRLLRPHHI